MVPALGNRDLPTTDHIFFREWLQRAPGDVRSLVRAAAIMNSLGLNGPHLPLPSMVTVVGSKGKGTTAIFASACLAAAGKRTVTISSPSFLSNVERIRVNGEAISDLTLEYLGNRLECAMAAITPQEPGKGYLSPGGLFTIAGLFHAATMKADALVCEAGRGGASDEISLVDPTVVAISPIFDEHVQELGGSLQAVVANKCGVIGEQTAAVTMAPQSPQALRLIREAVLRRTSGRIEPILADSSLIPVPLSSLPAGLGRHNALLGCYAAYQLLSVEGDDLPSPSSLEKTLRSVSLPGRLSEHTIFTRTGPTQVILDAAINHAGYRAAVRHARQRWGSIDHVLISLPDDKDHEGAVTELAGLPTTFVSLHSPHLRYTRAICPGWKRVTASDMDREFVGGLGSRILALGTISFIAQMLSLVGANADMAFAA